MGFLVIKHLQNFRKNNFNFLLHKKELTCLKFEKMKNKAFKKIIFTSYLLFSLISYAQNSVESYFDNELKKENLVISNGKLFTNSFKTLETDQFYTTKYSIETLQYKNQTYADVSLKYDIHRDILIFRPFGESENFGIELISEHVNSFTLKNKTFVNLSLATNDSIDFVKGYFEENFKSEKINFYIKHKKDTKEFINNQRIYNRFQNYNRYILSLNNVFYEIKNTKDLIKIFPSLKKDLKQFSNENASLLKTDKDAFFEKMIKKISTLIQ